MSKAVDQVVFDPPDRLHVRIDDRRTHEAEATALQILAHGVGLGAARGDIAFGPPAVLDRATVDEAPLVRVEAAELRLHVEERLRVLDRRFNLRSVAHDPRICEQSRDLPFLVASDLPWVELVEGAPVGVSLAQDRAPAQSRLGTLKNEELDRKSVV